MKIFYFLLAVLGQFVFAASSAGSNQQNSESSFEIIGCSVSISIFPAEQRVECIDTMTLHRLNDGDLFKARLVPIYHVQEILIDGDKAEYDFENGTLSIAEMPGDSIVDIIIHYSGEWRLRSEFSAITSGYSIFRDSELFPTVGGIFSFVRIKIEVPSGWKTVTVGDLTRIENKFEREIHYWKCLQPLSEIGWICAGDYWSDTHQLSGIRYDCFGNKDDSALINSAILPARDAIQYYSEHFTPYRFSKLSIVEVEDWVAGGNVLAIAAPSFIMVKRTAFTTDDQFNRIESILAHEVAHEWWPLTVFINQIDAAFLAEGICEYSSLIFHTEKGSLTGRDSLKIHPLLRPLIMRAQVGNDLPLQQHADLRYLTTHYLKATYVHHMLRGLIGGSVYSDLLNKYAEKYSGQNVTLENFQTLAESLSGISLQWFFNQWVRKKGIPRLKIYNIHTEQIDTGWRTHGRVRILGYEKFRVGGDIEISSGLNNKRINFMLGVDSSGSYLNDVPFEIITQDKPKQIRLDPDGDILMMQKLPAKISDLREPSDGVMIIGTQLSARELRELAMRDSIEMQKAGWTLRLKSDSMITLRDLQNERVFIYGKPNENKIAAEIDDKFTHRFRNDSLVIKNELFFDSSTALIEAIDNPYFANGLIIRVIPFSEKAKPELKPYDYSWIIVRGHDKIVSGVWDVRDEDLVVEIK
jgi:hypothetical protein